MSILDVEISCFNSVRETDNPETVNLLQWLQDTAYKEIIQELRSLPIDKYKRRKKLLPGITPSGTFSSRKETDIIRHSGLIQFDIDSPTNVKALKEKIKRIPYVAYVSYSTSGKGLWGLIPVKHPNQHKAHFRALESAFSRAKVKLDPVPKNVSSFRFVSYDPDPYFNHEAEVFPYVITPDKSTVPAYTDNRDKIEQLINKIRDSRIDITEGYQNWLKIGFALEQEFGESGRMYFHAVSQWHPEYDPKETDKQYTNCIQSKGSGVSIGTFFKVCKEYGITFDKVHESNKDRALEAKFKNEDSAPFGFNPFSGEIFDQRGYPAEWDSINQTIN